MVEISTTTHRQYVKTPKEEEWAERYEIRTIQEDELYVSRIYVEDDKIETHYEPDWNGWGFGRQINDSELPLEHLEELEELKDRLSISENISAELEPEKADL